MQTRLKVTGCVSSCAGFSDEATERQIHYLGKWRRIGDRVRYDYAKGFWRLLKFPIVFISVEGCAQIKLPKFYGVYYGWKNTKESDYLATIIGNTICPSSETPSYLKCK